MSVSWFRAAVSASSLVMKRRPSSVLFKVVKKWKSLAPGRNCRVRGPGAPNRRWQCGLKLLLPCAVSHDSTHSYASLGTAGTIAAPFASTWRQDHTPPIGGLWMLAGHALFRCPVFNTALRRHRLREEDSMSNNKNGTLPVDIEHSDTSPILYCPWEI
jgi:hypothetical protein